MEFLFQLLYKRKAQKGTIQLPGTCSSQTQNRRLNFTSLGSLKELAIILLPGMHNKPPKRIHYRLQAFRLAEMLAVSWPPLQGLLPAAQKSTLHSQLDLGSRPFHCPEQRGGLFPGGGPSGLRETLRIVRIASGGDHVACTTPAGSRGDAM